MDTALASLGLRAPDPARITTNSGGDIREGSKDTIAVRNLQAALAELGYSGADGKALDNDGNFGPQTQFAIKAFQQDHHLLVDGIVGASTTQALGLAIDGQHRTAELATVDINHPSHSGNPLYQQAYEAACRLDTQLGRPSDHYSRQLAGALAVAGKANGMSEIHQVALNDDGSRAWAIQDGLLQRVADVDTQSAVNTPLAQSARIWEQIPQMQAGANQALSTDLKQGQPASQIQQTPSM